MIKLTDLLIEQDMDGDTANEIIDALATAEKLILKLIKRNSQLKGGKINWKTQRSAEYPGHIEFQRYSGMDKNAFMIELEVTVEREYVAHIYVKGLLDRKGEPFYKANVFDGSGLADTFKRERNLFKYLKDEIERFQFAKRIDQDLPDGARTN